MPPKKRSTRSNQKKKKGKKASAQAELPTGLEPVNVSRYPVPSVMSPSLNAESSTVDMAVNDFLRKVLLLSISGAKTLHETALVAQFAPDDDERLSLACELGEAAIVASMMEAGTGDVNMRAKDGSTPLIIASQRGHVDVAKLLIKSCKAALDCKWIGNTSTTPLIFWCEHGEASVVRLLLKKGASPNLADEFGTTPIYAAAKNNHAHLLPLLYGANADPNRKRAVDGATPILVSAQNGHESCLESLHHQGGDLNVRLKDGATCLTLAVQNHHTEVVKKLLKWGCFANAVCEKGCSPLWIAASRGHHDLIEPLLLADIGMLFLDDAENKMNPFEIALCTDNATIIAEIGRCLPAVSSKIKDVLMCADNNIELLPMAKGDEQSFSKLLGMEDIPVIVSEDPCLNSKKTSQMPLKGSSIELPSAGARVKGNELFKDKKFNDAVMSYEEAMVLDSMCPLAPSNAAEAALQLCDYKRAFRFSSIALTISPMNKKTWFRYVRSLAGLSRASEAYVWIADLAAEEGLDLNDQVNLLEAVSKVSPFCYKIPSGLIVERDKHTRDQYRIVTTAPIKSQQVLSKEIAAVPWTYLDVREDERMISFVDNVTPEQIETIHGIFPRTHNCIPSSVKLLASLEEKVGRLMPAGTEDEIREWCRVLACAKLCAFDNGIHHFASFYNHSCEPNCEVRSVNNLEVVATRDIGATEELCISYINGATLNCPVAFRQKRLQNGWGNPCLCPRCLRESQLLIATGITDLEHYCGDTAVLAFENAARPFIEENGFCFPPDLPSRIIVLKNWQEVPWKQAWVLNQQFVSLQHDLSKILILAAPLVVGKASADSLARLTIKKLQTVEDKGAIQCLSLLVEQKRTYLPANSRMIHEVYQALKTLIDLFLASGLVSNVEGFHTELELLKKHSELQGLLETSHPTLSPI
jgi:ankyrin repeat protein